MKKLIIGLGLICSVAATLAITSEWKLTDIIIKDKIVGHIYSTEAVGSQISNRIERMDAGLRLICPLGDYTAQGSSVPILAIVWEGMHGNIPRSVEVQVSDRPVGTGAPMQMKQDGTVLYKPLSDIKPLLQAFKTGKNVSLSWAGTDTVRRVVIFSLHDFNKHLAAFNASCKLDI